MRKRGPSSFKTQQLQLPNNLTLVFASSVLALRGGSINTSVTEQPLTHPESGNILLWNGELFASDTIQINENDSLHILNALCANFEETTEKDILNVFEHIKGVLCCCNRNECFMVLCVLWIFTNLGYGVLALTK